MWVNYHFLESNSSNHLDKDKESDLSLQKIRSTQLFEIM